MNYSSIGKRILAFLIDMAAVNLIVLILIPIGYVVAAVSAGVIFITYNILMLGSPWHATPGQKVLDICIVDKNGEGIGYLKATIRTLCFLLSTLLLGAGHLIGLFSDKKQTLQDKIAGTYVVVCPYETTGFPTTRKKQFQAKIIGVYGEKAGVSFNIEDSGLMIGHDPTICSIALKHSRGISRLHCFVSYNRSTGLYVLYDRNSTYGTFTESGRRIHPTNSITLKSGERFYLGSPHTMFEVG